MNKNEGLKRLNNSVTYEKWEMGNENGKEKWE